MITLEDFLKRWPERVDQTTKDEIQLFIDTVTDLSGDYEAFVSRLRATGKFKSIFGDFGANAHRTTNMNYIPTILSSKERAAYPGDLYKTLLGIAQNGKKNAGLATAISDLLGKQNPSLDIGGDDATHTTLLVPLEALLTRKAQNVTTATAGGFLVANDIGHQIEFALRSASVCIRAGARVLPGLRSDLTLGRETQEVTYDWLAELEEAQLADSQYGVVNLTPHRLAGLTSILTQLNAQAPDLSAFVVESLTRGIGAGFDRAAIQGIGAAGEPLGLFNRESVKTVTFGGAATWAKAVNFEKQISAANGDDDAITFLAEPAVREKWRTLERFSGGGKAFWEDGNICAGRSAYVTTDVPSTKICAGDFTKMIFASWGEGSPVAVIVDPFTAKKSGKIEILVSLMGDVGVLREEVFCVSTDSAIQ
jgi:HK97 family phage major capsid protein